MSNILDFEVLKEFRNTAAYSKIEDQLLQDKKITISKLKTVDSFDIQKVTELQAKIKYIEYMLRLVDSKKNS